MGLDISARDARRIALSAVGLAALRPARRGAGAMGALVDRLGQLQIDSANVLARAHYLPAYSRLAARRRAAPAPRDAAQRRLLMVAARALGVATTGDLRANWWIGPADAACRVAELVEMGDLLAAQVEGWVKPAYMPADLPAPRRARAAAIVSPFDPLLWERDRAERLLGFRYRIEIYTPAHRREHGYYVLPFLMGDRIVARLDLRADRTVSCLIVLGAHFEPGALPDVTAGAVASEMLELARWLGLADVQVRPNGSLSPALTEPLRRYYSDTGLPYATGRT